MSEIKAGVIIKSRFVTAQSKYGKNKGFKGYVDYMDRAEAVSYDKFNNYMSNEEKSDGLFLPTINNPSPSQIQELKDKFKKAQEKGSVLEQLIISFDMNYLEEYEVVKNGQVNGDVLKDYTRIAMQELIEKEGNMQNFIWSGAIHYNTDNVHIHVGMVDTAPSWTVGEGRCFNLNGKPTQRGKFKLSSLNKAKSVYVNNIINSKEKNTAINSVMYDSILTSYKADSTLKELKTYKRLMKNLMDKLPENRGLWKYNMHALDDVRNEIDAITDWILENEYHEEYEEFVELIEKLDAEYEKSYGSNDYQKNGFKENKVNELYSRIGNVILKEALNIAKNEDIVKAKRVNMRNKFKNTNAFHTKITPVSDLYFSLKKVKRVTRDNIDSLKNQAIYERNERKAEYEKERN